MDVKEHQEDILEQIRKFNSKSDFMSILKETKNPENSFIILNNSFVFRDKIATNKSKYYLMIDPNNGELNLDGLYVCEHKRINKEFQIVAKNKLPVNSYISIEKSIKNQYKTLGDIIFVLMSKIDDNVSFSEKIDDVLISKIVFDPHAKLPFSINESNEIVVNDIESEKDIWDKVYEQLILENKDENELLDALKIKVIDAVIKLKKEVTFNLEIPDEYNQKEEYFLEIIANSIKKQYEDYKRNIDELNSNNFERKNAAMMEILRLSYLFSDDAIKVIRLLINLCDLKPIVLWKTYNYHYELDLAIRELPFVKQKEKPSLNDYIDTIKKARNKTFHRLIPFSSSFEFKFPDNSIKDARMKIFSEYGRKSESGIDYTDKDLVTVLQEFTRTSEEIVTEEFWIKNKNVILSSLNLVNGIAKAIRSLK